MRTPRPHILAVANTKGGVGKSTLAVSLAVEAARAGKSVLLVDADPQASAMQFLAVRDTALPPVQGVQITTATLHRQMAQLAAPYDLAVIDVGGRDAPVFRSALTAADTVLIPLVASAFDSWASQDVLAIVDELASVREFSALAVLNQLTHTVVAREAFSALSSDLASRSVHLLDSRIHHRTAWPRAIGEGLSVGEWEPSGTAAEELRGLCVELGIS